jgi:uroporphyrinogen-III decarboxylase
MERLVPLEVKRGVSGATANGVPVVFIPLHKGADGFMSDEQFDTFYWPALKQVILGLVEEGIVPMLFAEGGYNSRLEAIKDLPRGKVIWHFDRTDMAQAKLILGDIACIMGNVPASLLFSGTPEEVTQYCEQLIDTAGNGGGFILAEGAVIDEGQPENILAVVEAAKSFGVY